MVRGGEEVVRGSEKFRGDAEEMPRGGEEVVRGSEKFRGDAEK